MSDTLSPQQRHECMSHIRSTSTKPEIRLRKELWKKGFRYRKNDKRLPGSPDIVLPKYKTAIFVNGCFWHMHDCPDFVLPKSNLDYWLPKLQRNKKRDAENADKLLALGWRVITIWTCELSSVEKCEKRLSFLIEELK